MLLCCLWPIEFGSDVDNDHLADPDNDHHSIKSKNIDTHVNNINNRSCSCSNTDDADSTASGGADIDARDVVCGN